MIEQTVLHLAENIKFRSKDLTFIFINYNLNLCNNKMATLTLASSSESNPLFQTFYWKIISLQFNAISVLYVPLFLFEEQWGLHKCDPHMIATFKYHITRLIVSRLHINYTFNNKANITINPLAPNIRYTCHTDHCTKYHTMGTAFIMQHLFKFQSAVHHTGHLILAPKG